MDATPPRVVKSALATPIRLFYKIISANSRIAEAIHLWRSQVMLIRNFIVSRLEGGTDVVG